MCASCSSASIRASARRRPGITSPATRTGSGNCSATSGLVPEPIGYAGRRAAAGVGVSGSPTSCRGRRPGIDTLRPARIRGRHARTLRRKVRRWTSAGRGARRRDAGAVVVREARGGIGLRLGLQIETRSRARACSCCRTRADRNANFSYQEMLAAFRGLRRFLERKSA